MGNNEKDLSEYIDRLNAEQKPRVHGQPAVPAELEKLFGTVRLVRSLKEPALPESDYPKKLARTVADQISKKNSAKKTKNPWFIGFAAAAAVLVMAAVLNFISPFGRTNVVYAMEQAFQGVKAYHGFLEIVETNAGGNAATQAKLEVWADREGHYYVKQLEGAEEGLITVNNGQKKWQIRPEQKQAHILPVFPDPYRFTFELGKEVEEVGNALETKVVGEEMVAGRKASVLEVTPEGGLAYRIWIDKETKLPLQKQSGMQNALQYRVTYTKIEHRDALPSEFITYRLPDGFKEINTKPEQIVTDFGEARGIAGFTPKVPENIPAAYGKGIIAVETDTKTVKIDYSTQDNAKKVMILERKSTDGFKPASTAVLGKIGGSVAEIQSPVQEGLGVLGGGPYAGLTDISSIRWQQDGIEYAVIGTALPEELAPFVKSLTNEAVDIPSADAQSLEKPKMEVTVDLKAEENEQKSVDAGHSPWRLDPAFVAQVFVSLKISPEGITGEYPVKYEDLKVTLNNGRDAVVELGGDNMPVRKVYLKRLIRQDSTGIWSVAGYDPADRK